MLRLNNRTARRRTKRATTAYTTAVRRVLPHWNHASDADLVQIGAYLLVLAATGDNVENLSDGLAIASEFANTADLAMLATLAHEHLADLLFE